MTLVDANLLLYAVNRDAPEHERAAEWLEDQLNGTSRLGMPWESLIAFVRLATNPRVLGRALSAQHAWSLVQDWLDVPVVWIPGPTDQHAEVLGNLITKYRLRGKLLPDAHIAAPAIEHGLDVYSADTDFARFGEIRWIDPLAS